MGDSKMTVGDLALIRAAILTVIDDGDGCAAGAEYSRKPWLIDHENEDLANDQRLRFCDAVQRQIVAHVAPLLLKPNAVRADGSMYWMESPPWEGDTNQ